jgi:hypothetical protein
MEEEYASFILDHVAICPGMFECWRDPALACRLRIVNLYASSEHEVRCVRPTFACNGTVPPSVSRSIESYHAAESPLAMLDQEARSHKPCQHLLHHSRLSRRRLGVHDSMIVAGDCGHGERLNMGNWRED